MGMGVAWGMEGGGTEKVAFSQHKLTMFLWCGIIKEKIFATEGKKCYEREYESSL